MAKRRIKAKIKLHIPGGQATPAPPVGPALGQHGVNIGEFVQKFNAQTQDTPGVLRRVWITVYPDRTFDMVVGKPPTAVLLKQRAGIAKGASNPGREVVATISRKEVEEIAKEKLQELNTEDLGAAVRIVEGTARSMGIAIED